MTKDKRKERVDTTIAEAKSGLQEWYNNTPVGVRKQLAKNHNVVKTWDTYGVKYDE